MDFILRLFGVEPIGQNMYFLIPMPLYFRVFKRFRFTTTPYSKEVICDHRVEIGSHIHIFKVPFLCRVSELPAKEIGKNFIFKTDRRYYLWYQFMTLTPSASLSDK